VEIYSWSCPLDGGTVWEVMKRRLRKTIGNKCLTEKQLVTVLTEIEVVLNSRPLVYLDDSVNSHFAITPSTTKHLTYTPWIQFWCRPGIWSDTENQHLSKTTGWMEDGPESILENMEQGLLAQFKRKKPND